MTVIKNILITRPSPQGEQLSQQLQQQNYTVNYFPQLKITPSSVEPLLLKQRQKHYDRVIFISPNAVKYGLNYLKKGIRFNKIAAIGKGCVFALKQANITCDISPSSNFTSEGLLQHHDMQNLAGAKVLIVRGNGGREKLKNTLQAHGAQVDYLEVYQRQAINYSAQAIQTLCKQPIDLVQISNQQTLALLVPLIKQAQWFKQSQWWLLSERTIKTCKQYGIKEHLCSQIKPGNQAFLKNL